jgi:hypothetical protein
MRFNDYLAAFNRYDDEALLRDFWTEDCIMQSDARVMKGHAQMLEFMRWAHDGILETMRPVRVVEHSPFIFAEVDMDFTATKDKPGYVFGSLQKGESVTVKFFLHYETEGGKVSCLKAAKWSPNVGVVNAEASGQDAMTGAPQPVS